MKAYTVSWTNAEKFKARFIHVKIKTLSYQIASLKGILAKKQLCAFKVSLKITFYNSPKSDTYKFELSNDKILVSSKGKFCKHQHFACVVLSVISEWEECADLAMIPIILPLNLPLSQAIILDNARNRLCFAVSANGLHWWLNICGIILEKWGRGKKEWTDEVLHFFFSKHKLEHVTILTLQKLATGNQISV